MNVKDTKILKIIHSLWSYLWIFNFFFSFFFSFFFFSYTRNNYSTVVYGGNIIRFWLFWSTKLLSWSSTVLHVNFYASSDLLMACGTMQLTFFKLGTVLTYAFKSSCESLCHPYEMATVVLGQRPTGDIIPHWILKNKAQLLPTRTTIPRTTPH